VIRLDDEALVAALSDEARRVAAADAAGQPTPGAWHRLEARRAQLGHRGVHRDGRWWAVRAALGAAAGAAALALVLGLHGWRTARPLTYDVGGGAVEEGGYIRGATGVGAKVQFSDGTRIDLGEGARMSVVAPGAHGARLRVEEGQAHFAVNHLPHAAWSVEAGPYVIEVTGTVFDVRWSGADEIVEVRLHTGSVRVSGPMLAEHATLRPGQRLTARLATRDLRIDESGTLGGFPNPPATTSLGGADRRQRESGTPDGTAAPTVTVPPPVLAAAAAATSAEARPQTEAPAAAVAHQPAPTRAVRRPARAVASLESRAVPGWAPGTWAARVSSGDTAGVVAEAVARGIDTVVAEADGPALVALADAARYSGRTYLAERVLRAERTRFPGTPAAGAAAFFLGRLADDRGAAKEGLDWYRSYLTEEPQGPYAAEALGREMLGVSRLSGRQAARDLARDYLDRFPDGTYLLHAQAILQGR
jgi:ferric-dicitrate binding protein FerR (iron transport regulator)/TolA-binding protein